MQSGEDILLFHFTGEDGPGHVATLTSALAQHAVTVLDVSQSVIHRTQSLGVLVRLKPETDSSALSKDLVKTAHGLGLALRVTPVEEAGYESWRERDKAPEYVLSLLSRQITAGQISAVSTLLAEQGLNIEMINRLSGRLPKVDEREKKRACLEFSVTGEVKDEKALQAALIELTHREPIDLAWQHDTVYRRMRRLVVFDMDSTLIRQEVIDELAKEAGVGEQVIKITESAMRGELNFDQSLTQRVALLKGLEVSRMDRVAERLELTEGAEVLLRALKRFGFKTAILSGGFRYFGEIIGKKLGIDYVHTNDLEMADGRLTGNVQGPIVNAQRKADLLKEIAARENISLEQTIAVGDGANDLPMLATAGLGVAFHAKPLVAATARHRINCLGLDGVLYLIGVRDRDLD